MCNSLRYNVLPLKSIEDYSKEYREGKIPEGYHDGLSLFYLPISTPYDTKICQNISKQSTLPCLRCNGFEPAALSSPIQNKGGKFDCTKRVKDERPCVSFSILISSSLV